MINEPESIKYYEESIKEYKERWFVFNQALYDLCIKYPRHNLLPNVIAKVGIISRAYSAGLERQGNPTSDGGAIVDVANEFVKNHETIDNLITQLQSIANRDDCYSIDTIPIIIETHYKILQIVKKVTRDSRNPRSFVSKYLHFHARGVPIFDSYVRTVLADCYSKKDINELQISLNEYDNEYSKYCFRFLLLWNATMVEKQEHAKPKDYLSVRHLDHYLQWVYNKEYIVE